MTEYTEEDGRDGRIIAAWMHRKGNVHDLAFTNGAGPRLHHMAYWISSPLHIIHLCDVMASTGYLANMERGPGRHGISNAFFLYVRDPDGHRTEFYSSDYQTMDPDHEPLRWSVRDPRRQTLWGQPAPRTWFEEGTAFAGTAGARRLVQGGRDHRRVGSVIAANRAETHHFACELMSFASLNPSYNVSEHRVVVLRGLRDRLHRVPVLDHLAVFELEQVENRKPARAGLAHRVDVHDHVVAVSEDLFDLAAALRELLLQESDESLETFGAVLGAWDCAACSAARGIWRPRRSPSC